MVLKRRHLAKAITYRLGGSFLTALIVWGFTGHYSIAITVFAFDSIAKIILYYIHERIWYHIKWGVNH